MQVVQRSSLHRWNCLCKHQSLIFPGGAVKLLTHWKCGRERCVVAIGTNGPVCCACSLATIEQRSWRGIGTNRRCSTCQLPDIHNVSSACWDLGSQSGYNLGSWYVVQLLLATTHLAMVTYDNIIKNLFLKSQSIKQHSVQLTFFGSTSNSMKTCTNVVLHVEKWFISGLLLLHICLDPDECCSCL